MTSDVVCDVPVKLDSRIKYSDEDESFVQKATRLFSEIDFFKPQITITRFSRESPHPDLVQTVKRAGKARKEAS